MEWPDVVRLLRYWRDHPPVHELLAAFLGFKAPEPEPEWVADSMVKPLPPTDFAALLAAHNLPLH